uniref:Photolyase/cryptochrome alpha/beta domain-containing protein n=1 Tax=viral metagenome TaxID=1070528 RepID=A0A6C0JWZ2_9ZZZZ
MAHTKKTGLFLFHRDLRIHDNVGFLEACKQCSHLITCFIFTPEQVGKHNSYKSENAVAFMIESLAELSKEIHLAGGELCLFYGKTNTILKDLVKTHKIDAVFFNRDYSPYAKARDESVADLCNTMHIECITSSDYYLYEPGSVKTGGGSYYKKFTPFYEAVLHIDVPKPQKASAKHLACLSKCAHNSKISVNRAIELFGGGGVPGRMVEGGRANALAMLRKGLATQVHYDATRDFLKNQTTGLSAAIKFGCISIREIYHAFLAKYGRNFGLIRELIWREFFAHVLHNFPEVLHGPYQPKFRHISWRTGARAAADFKAWKEGRTGFPIVDACMRQLNNTGYMHNRGRMIVANFLVKTLLIDWRLGEQYFAQKLTDYDPASNNGNWQGISGTGVDMKPYFRDMNPWIQSAKFDADAEFIKKWVPELADVFPRDIHKWNIVSKSLYKEENSRKNTREINVKEDTNKLEKYEGINYAKPIVDYDEQKDKMLAMYENVI